MEGKRYTLTLEMVDGTKQSVSFVVPDGKQGEPGPKGDPFTYKDFTAEQLMELKGKDGYSPVRGVDYWTDEDKDEIVQEAKDATSFVKSIAHRGYSIEAPENTIPAYVLSHKKGFKYAECDVRVTKDGVPVLLHDETIDRTSNGSGKVAEMTYAELLQYDFGSWKSAKYAGTKIPTFEEFIRCCKALGLHPYIEIENHASMTDKHIANCVYIVKKYGMLDNVTWKSFGASKLYVIRDTVPNARLAWLGYTTNVSVYEDLKREGNDVFLDLDSNSITEADIQKAIDNDIPVELWDVNSKEKILAMSPYISGVTSDFLIASDVLREAELLGVTKNYFAISTELINVTINNRSTVAEENSSYSASLTADTDFTVSVTMGGVDITSSVYADGAISIPSVTGNVVIVAVVPNSWVLVKTITPDQLHVGGNDTDYNADNGLFLTNVTNRVSYPHPDIQAVGGEAYKLEFDAEQNIQGSMQFYNQKQMNVFNRNGIGQYSNIQTSGWVNNGVEYTPPVEVNGSPIVGVRLTFHKTNDGTMDGTEITEARVYRRVLG